MSDINLNTVKINGVDYVRADSIPTVAPRVLGRRAVVVLDRGWIFAGDVERKDGRILMTKVVHVRSWSSIGFDGMIANPKSDKVVLRPHADLDVPAGSEVFSVPVRDDWGL